MRSFFLVFLLTALLFRDGGKAMAHVSAGGSAAWSSRQHYGNRTEHFFMPEFLAVSELPLLGPLHARVGVRGSYLWQQPDMPSSIRVEETDWSFQGEAGVAWNSLLVPSVSVGIGRIWRETNLRVSDPIASVNSQMSGSDEIDFWTLQLGLGLPVNPALILVEPFWRYQKASKDWRIHSVMGVEVSFVVF
jgi:hypothetical protein